MYRLDADHDDGRCLTCGSHVTPEFRRGLGDSDDHAHRCTECDVNVRIQQGSAAGMDVKHPDPLETGRFGSPDVEPQVAALMADGGEASDE